MTSQLLPFTTSVPIVVVDDNDDNDDDDDKGARRETPKFPVFRTCWQLFSLAGIEIAVSSVTACGVLSLNPWPCRPQRPPAAAQGCRKEKATSRKVRRTESDFSRFRPRCRNKASKKSDPAISSNNYSSRQIVNLEVSAAVVSCWSRETHQNRHLVF